MSTRAVARVKISQLYLFLVSFQILGMVGCSYFQRGGADQSEQNNQLNNDLPPPPTDPSEEAVSNTKPTKAGIGAAAGGVIGGGLGAIVGSTSGNAGEGFAIGALTGAAAGGVVGHQLDRNEIDVENQRETLGRQQELINNQQREINTLKDRGRDTTRTGARSSLRLGEEVGTARNASSRRRSEPPLITELNRPSRYSGRYSPATYRGNPQAKPFGTSDFSEARASSGAITPSSVRSARVARRSSSTADSSAERVAAARPTPPKPAIVEEPPIAKLTGSGSVEPATTDILSVGGLPPAVKDSTSVATEVKSAIATEGKSDLKSVEAKGESARLSAVQQASGIDCEEGGKEAMSAKNATSDADRLFYYRRALKLCPTNASYHVEIGQVYASIGRKDDAKFEFRQAIDLDQDNADAHEQLSLLENN